MKADDARMRLRSREAVRKLEHAVKEAFGKRCVRVEQEQPIALTEPAAVVDCAGKASIGAPSPHGHAGLPPQSSSGRMGGGVVVNNHDLCVATSKATGGLHLPNQVGGAIP